MNDDWNLDVATFSVHPHAASPEAVARMASDLMAANAEIERLKRIQPCGHPVACIVGSDEGTNYCGWCADLAEIERLREAKEAGE